MFGLFAYKAGWANDPWLELDSELVGEGAAQVQPAIHMEDAAGNHIANLEKTVSTWASTPPKGSTPPR